MGSSPRDKKGKGRPLMKRGKGRPATTKCLPVQKGQAARDREEGKEGRKMGVGGQKAHQARRSPPVKREI